MKQKKIVLTTFLLALIAIVVIRCQSNSSDSKTAAIFPAPYPLPTNIVPNFNFPEDSNKIYSWLQPNYDSSSVYNHAWGIWAGLTASTNQTYERDTLLVYQTWPGIGELQQIVQTGFDENKNFKTGTGRASLTIPHQLKHELNARKTHFKLLKGTIDTSAGNVFGTNFWVAVSYNLPAATHAVKNSLFKQSVLNSYLKQGAIGAIPAFPNNAITTKPVYFVGHVTDSLIRIPVWPGPPSNAQPFSPQQWFTYVYADVHNAQQPGKKLTPVTTDSPTPSQIQAATCNVSDFINFKIDEKMANYLNVQDEKVQGDTAKAGDIALLVAMHVTSKEISNWTWQTFYWDYNPASPTSPSSALAAKLKPTQLSSSAAHYSLSTSYVEVIPNQPVSGGKNQGIPMIGYNPYLEAGFSPATFVDYPNTLNPKLQYGIQTNCMSCHALATPQSIDTSGNTFYSTAQYVDMKSSFFINKVQLDFAWSIQAAIIPDTSTSTKK